MKFYTIAILLFASVPVAAQDNASEVWAELVGERFMKRPEFSFVQNDATLPNVLLYGDSISIGYTERVRKNLAGKANIYRLYLNGGDSSSFIPKMEKMHQAMRDKRLAGRWSFDWNVIHFNVGLHDLKYVTVGKLDKKNGKQVSSVESYERNLRNIVIYLKILAPKAKLIFATTTPVPAGELGRIEGDAAKYNTAALIVLKEFPEVAVNDLYNFTKPHHAAWWRQPGNVHYNTLGTNEQGDEVAHAILSQ